MVKKPLLVLAIFILLICIFVITRTKSTNKYPPIPTNIVIISVDTLRADHMSTFGYKKNTTPKIDEWAKDAYVFPKTYTMTPMTYPSFFSFMTGKSPFLTSIYSNLNIKDISKSTTTLATKFKENGFKTGAFVTNVILQPKITKIDQGFDTYEYNDAVRTRDKNYDDSLNHSLEWIDSHQKDKFFLWVHLLDPHYPYEPPKEFKCKFDEKTCPILQSKTDEEMEIRRFLLKSCHISSSEVDQKEINLFQTLYDGEIYQMDLMVGKILDHLKANNLDKNTLVVIYGDHGEGFDHNYLFAHKLVLYNSNINIPFILKYPGLRPDGNNYQQTLVQNNDIYPTLLDIFRISYKESSIDGISFYNNLFTGNQTNNQKTSLNRSAVYAMNMELSKFAIIEGNYKYIYSVPNKMHSCLYLNQEEELYDLANDPSELSNLVKIRTDIYNNLKSKLFDYVSSHPLQNYFTNAEPYLPPGVINNLKKLDY